jgi:histidyl-tRNA synthetase
MIGMKRVKISEENIRNLKKLQNVINTYDGSDLSIDGAVKRLLDFYSRFVPLKRILY